MTLSPSLSCAAYKEQEKQKSLENAAKRAVKGGTAGVDEPGTPRCVWGEARCSSTSIVVRLGNEILGGLGEEMSVTVSAWENEAMIPSTILIDAAP